MCATLLNAPHHSFSGGRASRTTIFVVQLPHDNMKPEYAFDIAKHIAEHYGFSQ